MWHQGAAFSLRLNSLLSLGGLGRVICASVSSADRDENPARFRVLSWKLNEIIRRNHWANCPVLSQFSEGMILPSKILNWYLLSIYHTPELSLIVHKKFKTGPQASTGMRLGGKHTSHLVSLLPLQNFVPAWGPCTQFPVPHHHPHSVAQHVSYPRSSWDVEGYKPQDDAGKGTLAVDTEAQGHWEERSGWEAGDRLVQLGASPIRHGAQQSSCLWTLVESGPRNGQREVLGTYRSLGRQHRGHVSPRKGTLFLPCSGAGWDPDVGRLLARGRGPLAYLESCKSRK